MLIKNNKRISLLRYWTSRYLITLCIGLVVIAIISALWIRHTTLENRLDMTKLMAEEIADRFVDISEGRPSKGDVPGSLTDRGRFMNIESDPSIYIVDTAGTILSSNRSSKQVFQQFPRVILQNEENVQKLRLEETGRDFYVVKAPIVTQDYSFGWVVIIELEDNLTRVNQEYRQLAIMIISLALLGWAAIYFLSRRLANPIKDVARAAKQVQAGDYNIHLPDDMREQEVYDLVQSFKEMSNRLQTLETLRTELLAGVTHELKTPVTSISGLLQALNDEVVTGEDAKEFLALSLNETTKMKKMVEDLLAFNSFAANAIPINKENHSINEFMADFIHQWEVIQEDELVDLIFTPLKKDRVVQIDPIRLQQIITNLLNNAGHAIDGKGKIIVTLAEMNNELTIDIKDSGSGIPVAEQDLIFERFFRGEGKKYKIRGLGLGLPFSKMIAQSHGGDLVLIESTSSGTTFRITLPLMS
ncbi:HAMP domain-containing sensor histidine kinase [Cytobacillus massiliigabonensis]|uniref:HAMP domain-containing sensor histidine kinase n=1 Tax=Cytobacillus massiliigabonensis TaxID=1871011 RepID=UPI001F17A872|nr:HAMP domain-containing sensor histidine kinase [Cytobacillus massiliigabonensis]